MSNFKRETSVALKRVKPRYIVVNEDIHQALDLYSMSLYMTFRYEADYTQEDSVIKRSAEFLYTKAKISRRQFFLSLNRLEDAGLISREPDDKFNSISTYHVAQELNFFNTDCRVVHDVHGVVHDVHTNHYSSSLSNINITISDLDDSSTNVNEEIVNAYHEVLPDSPKIKVLDSKLKSQLNHMRKNWPKYQKDGQKFGIQSFKDYLNYLKEHYPWFIKPYSTESGNVRRNGLRVFTREINITKIVNGEFSGK